MKVNYDNAVLLKEAGFDEDCYDYYTLNYGKGKPYITQGIEYDSDRIIKFDWNCNNVTSKSIGAPYPNSYHKSQCSAPSIFDAVQWIDKKFGIWISVEKFKDHAADVNDDYVYRHCFSDKEFKSSEDAYQSGIAHVLGERYFNKKI